jgi:acetoin utilization deacetylase AcuC-like enzyme
MLDDAAYGEMAASLRVVASELDVPVLVCLEGGYALDALAASVSATIAAFAGSQRPRQASAEPAAPYREHLRERWGSLSA